MTLELRCDAKKHGELDIDEGYLEVKCSSRFCGAATGVIVLHRFDVHTGSMVGTHRYKEPEIGASHGT